ncbi:MAG: DUF417 family protein [Deinococcus sp.]|nr:DUF417 family protein [Deinococcus sp.]
MLIWIGTLKFADPSPVVGLLGASISFLAFPAFVYLLGAVEVILGLALWIGIAVKYVGIILLGLFAGTILIFLMAPRIVPGVAETYGAAGFPFLSLLGEFLLKDLVLFAACVATAGLAAAKETKKAS